MNLVAAAIFVAGGGFFVLASLGIFLIQRRINRTRTPVKLLVVDSHARTGERGASYIHLEYKITHGPHAGLQQTSETGTYPPLHATGDLVDGYFDSATGNVHSRKEDRLTRWVIFGFAGLGGIMLALGIGVLSGQWSL
ncbi:MAG: DUF3592 domain-containing protein [Pseudomonadota bacterium]